MRHLFGAMTLCLFGVNRTPPMTLIYIRSLLNEIELKFVR